MQGRLPLTTNGLFSPNVAPGEESKMLDNRYGTGAPMPDKPVPMEGIVYSEDYTVTHTFVFKPSESRLPSLNDGLSVDLSPFFAKVADILGPCCAQISKIVLRSAKTEFWAPVGLIVYQKTDNVGLKNREPTTTTRLACTTYLSERDVFVTASVYKTLDGERIVLDNSIVNQTSFSWSGGMRGGVRSLVRPPYADRTPQDETKRHWVVPVKSPLGLFFDHLAKENNGTEDKRKEWMNQLVFKNIQPKDTEYLIYEPKAAEFHETLIQTEIEGLYLEDVCSGVHKFSVHACPTVMPIDGSSLRPDKSVSDDDVTEKHAANIVKNNPMILTDFVLPISDREVIDRWNSSFSLTFSLQFFLTISK